MLLLLTFYIYFDITKKWSNKVSELNKAHYPYTPDTLAAITDVIVLTKVRICSVSDFCLDNRRFAAAKHRFSNGVPTTPFVTSISVSNRKFKMASTEITQTSSQNKRVSWDERELMSTDQ